MRTILAILILCLLSASCSYKYESKNMTGFESGWLVHSVVLSLKENTNNERKNEIIALLISLDDVPKTKGLFVAEMTTSDDPRALTDYDLILQMAFKNKTDLASYSTDKYHLEVRNKIKNDLAGKPIVYDYTID